MGLSVKRLSQVDLKIEDEKEKNSTKSKNENEDVKSENSNSSVKDSKDSEKSKEENKNAPVIHYLSAETEYKIKRYLKEGETWITDEDLQKRRKKFYLDSLFLQKLTRLVETLNVQFDTLKQERMKDNKRKIQREMEKQRIKEALRKKMLK